MYRTIQDAINKTLISFLPKEYSQKIDRLKFAEDTNSKYNKWGFSRDSLKAAAALIYPLYKNWFRVTCYGIENIPKKGRAILVSNHSGQLPFDAAMIVASLIFEEKISRLARTYVERDLSSIPILNLLLSRTGQICGSIDMLENLLIEEEIILMFPEGKRGIGKTFRERYQIKKFSKDAVKLALRCKAPIIPTVVIGAEEQIISLYNAKPLAMAFNLPYFPITPTFPLFGLLGLIPLPSKYEIYYGKPINYSDIYDVEFASDLDFLTLVTNLTKELEQKVQEMVDEGLKNRNEKEHIKGVMS